MTRVRFAFFCIVILLFVGALAYMAWATDEQYLPIALLLVCSSIVPFFFCALKDGPFRPARSFCWPYFPR